MLKSVLRWAVPLALVAVLTGTAVAWDPLEGNFDTIILTGSGLPGDDTRFFNYDIDNNQQPFDPNQPISWFEPKSDWPINVIFWGQASERLVRHVYNQHFDWSGPGSTVYNRVRDNTIEGSGQYECDGSNGVKLLLHPEVDPFDAIHMRLYHPSTDYDPMPDNPSGAGIANSFYNTEWGYHVVASCHYDYDEIACWPATASYGWSEDAEAVVCAVAADAEHHHWTVWADYLPLNNWEDPDPENLRMQSHWKNQPWCLFTGGRYEKHYWQSDGLASIVFCGVPYRNWYDIELKAGQNLISLPVHPDDTDIEAVMAPIVSHVASVWHYDGPTQTYTSWAPGWGGDLETMEAGKGYWIIVTSDCTLRVVGDFDVVDDHELLQLGDCDTGSGQAHMPAYDGWNMLGSVYNNGEWQIDTCGELVGQNPVQGWDANLQEYYMVSPEEPLKPGEGYWFNVNVFDSPSPPCHCHINVVAIPEGPEDRW